VQDVSLEESLKKVTLYDVWSTEHEGLRSSLSRSLGIWKSIILRDQDSTDEQLRFSRTLHGIITSFGRDYPSGMPRTYDRKVEEPKKLTEPPVRTMPVILPTPDKPKRGEFNFTHAKELTKKFLDKLEKFSFTTEQHVKWVEDTWTENGKYGWHDDKSDTSHVLAQARQHFARSGRIAFSSPKSKWFLLED